LSAPGATGPLRPGDLEQLESTLLPALERHHLRLLAHSLRTLQQIAAAAPTLGQTPWPDQAAIEAWLQQQPDLNGESDFQNTLAQQLMASGQQLQQRAEQIGLDSALDLELDALIQWAISQADQRLGEP
jgi:hypothetical protein